VQISVVEVVPWLCCQLLWSDPVCNDPVLDCDMTEGCTSPDLQTDKQTDTVIDIWRDRQRSILWNDPVWNDLVLDWHNHGSYRKTDRRRDIQGDRQLGMLWKVKIWCQTGAPKKWDDRPEMSDSNNFWPVLLWGPLCDMLQHSKVHLVQHDILWLLNWESRLKSGNANKNAYSRNAVFVVSYCLKNMWDAQCTFFTEQDQIG